MTDATQDAQPSAAFTPGPWIADDNGSCVYTEAPTTPGRCYGYGCGHAFVCDLNDGEYHEYSDPAEQIANARLIAAAPELYEALKGLVAWYGARDKGSDALLPADQQETEVRRAMAALARAEGH